MKVSVRNYIYVVSVSLLLVALFAFRDKITLYMSALQTKNVSVNSKKAMTDTIARRYNYEQNGKEYQATFLEFGATTCYSCKLMKNVMDEIGKRYAGKVNVVFVDVRLLENKELIEYFGITTIPAQVLLGRDGKECYRHSGYISADDLAKKLGTP